MRVPRITQTIVNWLADADPKGRPREVFDGQLRGFLLRIEPTGRRSYYLAYQSHEGKRRRLHLGPDTALRCEQARKLAAEAKAQVLAGRDPHGEREAAREAAQAVKRDDMTLGHWLSAVYAPWISARKKSGGEQVERLQRAFPSLMAVRMRSLTAKAIEQAVAAGGPAGGNLARETAYLKAAMTRAAAWGDIEGNPTASVEPAKGDRGKGRRALTDDEIARLRAALAEREQERRDKRERMNQWRADRCLDDLPARDGHYTDYLCPLIELALGTGLRHSELLMLRWPDVCLDPGIEAVTVRGSHAKSGQTRVIPLAGRALTAMTAWRGQCDGAGIVFPGKHGDPMKSIITAWRALRDRAGLDKTIAVHSLRHSFCTRLLRSGTDLKTVQGLAGHADIATTAGYLHTTGDRMREAVGRLD